jgi:hypothetical protein
MDRGRAFAALLIALLALTGAAADQPIREARWVAPGRLITALTRQPVECLAVPANPATARSVAIGRAAFHAPMLLGGQAARAGLSCASCHRNGRGNRDFFLTGLSGAAGTADVTSSLMSKSRGDGLFNPKPIPDLAGPATTLKISRNPATDALERFITGLIVEEFDGHAPPPPVLAGLAAYVRAIRPEACKQSRDEPVTVGVLLDGAMAAAKAARDTDVGTARLMLSSARWSLGKIDERYAAADLDAVRAQIRAADRGLAKIQESIDVDATAIPRQIDDWQRMFALLRPEIERASSRSLFNPMRLSRYVSARRCSVGSSGSSRCSTGWSG